MRPGQVLAKLDDRAACGSSVAAPGRPTARSSEPRGSGQEAGSGHSPCPLGYVSRDEIDTLRSQAAVLKASVAADQAAVKTAQVELGCTVMRAPHSGDHRSIGYISRVFDTVM